MYSFNDEIEERNTEDHIEHIIPQSSSQNQSSKKNVSRKGIFSSRRTPHRPSILKLFACDMEDIKKSEKSIENIS